MSDEDQLVTKRAPVDHVPHVRTIAVLRANALGDLMVTLPALGALREAYREAEIVLLCQPWAVGFLRGRPGPVDRAVAVPAYEGVGVEPGTPVDGEAIERFFRRMQGEWFDLAIQLHGGGNHSNRFARRLGARLTAGARAPGAPPLDRTIPYVVTQHEIMRTLDIVRLVGAAPAGLEPVLSVTGADLAESRRVLPHLPSPLVAVHPGATNPERVWSASRFAAVADTLAVRGMTIVLVGGEADREAVAGVQRAMRESAIDLHGRLSLGGLAGLLHRCVLLVGNDSGPRHLALAVGTPTVGVFSAFNLINYGPLHQERHRPVISWRTAPADDRDGDAASRSYLTGVPVEAVLAAVDDLLAATQARVNVLTE